MDGSTRPAVLDGLRAEVAALLAWVEQGPDRDLGRLDREARGRIHALGGGC